MNLTREQIAQIGKEIGLDYAPLMTFITVESGGAGFLNGKIVIQFEPTWFSKYLTQFKIDHEFTRTTVGGKRKYKIVVGDKVIENGVEGQASEWIAFNTAFSIHPKAAMLSTSIGLMQIMGFNYATMGYKSVDEMWDDFKRGEYQQVLGGAKFIKSHAALYNALRNKNWPKVALYYNGENYKVNNYDTKLANAYSKYSK